MPAAAALAPTSPAAAPAARDPLRLARLKAAAREPGEAGFFFYEAHFGCEAVKVLPGEYFVADDDLLIMTTLGSCVAVCLWDRGRGIGGINHFMLPDAGDGAAAGGRYGGYAMELLINALMKRGAARASLEAKVFGGGAVISGMTSMHVGERNARFALDYLEVERIPVVSKDVLDIFPRKICFVGATGKAMVKRLATGNTEAVLDQERAAQKQAAASAAVGSVDLF